MFTPKGMTAVRFTYSFPSVLTGDTWALTPQVSLAHTTHAEGMAHLPSE